LSSTGLGALDEEYQIRALLQRMRYELRSAISAALVQLSEQYGQKKARQMVQGLTPYSWRHQFFADCKLTFDDPVVIAALGGHIDILPALKDGDSFCKTAMSRRENVFGCVHVAGRVPRRSRCKPILLFANLLYLSDCWREWPRSTNKSGWCSFR
jgi:hypothetical protein